MENCADIFEFWFVGVYFKKQPPFELTPYCVILSEVEVLVREWQKEAASRAKTCE